MRVALDGLLLGGQPSGVERSIAALVEALPLAAPEHDTLLVCCRAALDQVVPRQPRFCAPRWVRGRLSRIVYEQALMARALRRRCDLLHAPGYVMPLNWRGPAVLTVYDLIALQFPQYARTSNAWHYAHLLPASLRRADRIIVPSTVVAAEVTRRFPALAARLRVIPLGLPAHYAPASETAVASLRDRYDLPERFLLYVGNLEPKKNLPATVQAFEMVAGRLPHHLVLAGRPGWKTAELEGVLAASWARHRIHRLGYVPEDDLPALYTAADVLLQWSYYEGMGLPPLEAMACGTPAVVSDGGALPETVGEAGVVVPLGAPAVLAQILQDLLPDEARLAELSRRGREHAAGFTWQRHARAVADVYEELADA